ncbi:MAG: uncharacterized protein QOJ26_206, partial [Thermoplasmata archaeon]|nr:uncharacterized protein [Thermoplasmata archaeon]
GEYSLGVGDADDALAVIAAVEAECGHAPALVGYSFGGAVALRVATRRRLPRLVTVACPVDVLGSGLDPIADAPNVKAPAHLVVGDQDPYVTVEQARTLAGLMRPAAGLTVLPAAGHFLDPADNPRVLAAVRAALAALAAGA